jgi:hypothetical protein
VPQRAWEWHIHFPKRINSPIGLSNVSDIVESDRCEQTCVSLSTATCPIAWLLPMGPLAGRDAGLNTISIPLASVYQEDECPA